MGTPDFAVPSLARMIAAHIVVGVFTQPDRPAGRGRRPHASPVKQLAERHAIPVFQPASLRREPEAVQALADLAADVMVGAALGLLLPPAVLAAAPGGAVNVHASLLPRWRGAAPIQHAILAGDAETGVTIMRIDAGLDTGPMLARAALPLAPDATAGGVSAALAELGADLLAEILPRWLAGDIAAEPQDDAAATLAPRLSRADGRIDWSAPADAIARRVRAFDPWPGTFTEWSGEVLKVLAVEIVAGDAAITRPGVRPREAGEVVAPGGPPTADPAAAGQPLPGRVVGTADGPVVLTGAGALRLVRVQPAGRSAMDGAAFARGRPGFVGAFLGPAAVVEAPTC